MKLSRPVNPVFARELRQRMRGPRAAVILTLYLLMLVLIVQLLYSAASNATEFGGPAAENTAGLGRTVFQTLLFFVLLLVCFIVPSVTAGAIAGERERQTLVPLQVTLLRPLSILVGKLLASLAFVVLLIAATLPLAGISFLLGGVEPLEVLKATAMLLVIAVLLGALSLWCSTFLRGTQGATVVALGMAFFLCMGTFAVYGAQRLLDRGHGATTQLVLIANPFMAVADVLDRQPDDSSGGDSPFTPMQQLLRERREPPGRFAGGFQNGVDAVRIIDGQVIEGDQLQRRAQPKVSLFNRIPFWVESLATFAVLAAAAMAMAARRLALPRAALP